MGLASRDDPGGGRDGGGLSRSGPPVSAPSSGTFSAQGLPQRSDELPPQAGRRTRARRGQLAAGRTTRQKGTSREPTHLRREGRRAFRAAAHGHEMGTVDADGLSFLERNSLAPGSLGLYRERYHLFLRQRRQQRLPLRSSRQVDDAVVKMLHTMFEEGELSAEAQKLISVVKKFRPQLRGAGTLPRSQTAVRGFRRLAPPCTRQPLPWDCACLISVTLTEDGQPRTALATLLCFCHYGRPSEVLRLTREQIVPPVRRRGHAGSFWSVTLHPRENLESSKTGMHDESLQIDIQPYLFLGKILQQACKGLGAQDRVLPFSYATWRGGSRTQPHEPGSAGSSRLSISCGTAGPLRTREAGEGRSPTSSGAVVGWTTEA